MTVDFMLYYIFSFANNLNKKLHKLYPNYMSKGIASKFTLNFDPENPNEQMPKPHSAFTVIEDTDSV